MEEQIMEYLWQLKSLSERPDRLFSVPKPATTTVVTLLKRMQEKGFADHKVFGNFRQYYSRMQNGSSRFTSPMNLEQRKQSPNLYVMKAPVRKSPTPTQLQEWANVGQYGIWMDGKRIGNQALANYKAEDIALISTSRLAKNAINYGKHYVQVDLNTKEW